MVRVELVRDKVRRLRATIEALRSCLPTDPAGLAAYRDRLDLASFRVYLAMQEALDLASHVLADEGWGPAPSLRDHFAILAERGVIPGTLAGEIIPGVRVRNIIAHAYIDVDPGKLHAAAVALEDVAERYAVAVLAWAEQRAAERA